MEFPVTRLRRLRRTEAMRSLVREVHLRPEAFIYPLFICPGEGIRREISSMPGVYNLSVDEAMKEVEEATRLGLGGLLLFGLPAVKDEEASGAWAEDGIVQQALRAFKPAAKKLLLIADVCLCEYTSHGHCGVVSKNGDDYEIQNDPSLSLIARTAVSLAAAGADIVAPSDMMDGRVGAIRDHLDDAGLEQVPILSYAAKVASAFYGPFREAADSAPQFGDRRTYQMDGANLREAMREIDQDIAEGADMILMKPAMPYLDVLRAARERLDVPIGAYQVSGEYAMLQAAFAKGWLDRDRAILESLISIRRAGADFTVTYFAKEAARLLGELSQSHARRSKRHRAADSLTSPEQMTRLLYWATEAGCSTSASSFRCDAGTLTILDAYTLVDVIRSEASGPAVCLRPQPTPQAPATAASKPPRESFAAPHPAPWSTAPPAAPSPCRDPATSLP